MAIYACFLHAWHAFWIPEMELFSVARHYSETLKDSVQNNSVSGPKACSLFPFHWIYCEGYPIEFKFKAAWSFEWRGQKYSALSERGHQSQSRSAAARRGGSGSSDEIPNFRSEMSPDAEERQSRTSAAQLSSKSIFKPKKWPKIYCIIPYWIVAQVSTPKLDPI